MPPQSALETIQQGALLGCTEALFTFGERPRLEPGFDRHLSRYGYSDILDYCYDMAEKAIEIGLLPHTNAGVLTHEEMQRLSEVNASMGLMLETTARIRAHENSPGKDPATRIEMMECAGRLRIPFTTGILVGIGETARDREESLTVIRDLHRRYGHIQEVIIQNFCPKEGTPMEHQYPVSQDEMRQTIRMAREILPRDVAVQVPPTSRILDRSSRAVSMTSAGSRRSPSTISTPSTSGPRSKNCNAFSGTTGSKNVSASTPSTSRRDGVHTGSNPLLPDSTK
jgi:FO synthase subunit 1